MPCSWRRRSPPSPSRTPRPPSGGLILTPVGGYDHGGFDEGAAEIAAFDPASSRLFVVNAEAVTLDVLDLSDPAAPTRIAQLDMSAYGGGANSVAVHDGRVAVAIEAEETGAAGSILLTDGDGLYERIVGYGARSITVWSVDGERVWDSKDRIERAIVATYPALHNVTNDEVAAESGDSRSDAKGPEPEGLAVGEIDGVPYVFVGLERVGGVMAWDLSDRSDPELAAYRNDRPFFAAADGDDAGDLGPEGLVFVPAADAPGGVPLLIVAHEITGTTRVYEIAVR